MADMGRRCSPCFSPLDHKDVSYSTQKCELTGDQHTRSFWISLFPLFFPHFSPACCLSELIFVVQLATAAPRCRGKVPNTTQCPGPNTLTPRAPGGPVAKPRLERLPEQPDSVRSWCLPLALDKHPQPSFGDTREPAGIPVPLLVTASGLAQETRTWQEWEDTVGKPPVCPSSWRAQKLQLLQIAFGATVPAARQGLHWGKKWPYLALSPHPSQELKQCLDGPWQLGQSGLSVGFVPSVPSMSPCSPATGKHCLQPHFRQQPLPQWLSKKSLPQVGFCFSRGKSFLMPFPIILISSESPHSGHKS